jgi:hypothetical protein
MTALIDDSGRALTVERHDELLDGDLLTASMTGAARN